MDQPKIERVLRLMQLLSGARRYMIEKLAERDDYGGRWEVVVGYGGVWVDGGAEF